jgi:hypothetical protein
LILLLLLQLEIVFGTAGSMSQDLACAEAVRNEGGAAEAKPLVPA